jgi:hypothetical protein
MTHWEETSRYGTLRLFTQKETILTICCKRTLYYSWSIGKRGKMLSVDPDGGPYLAIGNTVDTPTGKWTIMDILKVERTKRNVLVICLRIKEGDVKEEALALLMEQESKEEEEEEEEQEQKVQEDTDVGA